MEFNPYKVHISKYSTHQSIINLIGKDKQVLDVGCNSGYLGATADKSNAFYGLDYLENAVSQAKKIYKDAVTYDLNKLKKLPWDKKFDVIVFGDVLEHVHDPAKVLSFFIDNYLTSKGSVVVSLPNVANWNIRLKLLAGKFNYTETGILDRTHVTLYTFNSAEELMSKTGLKVDEKLGSTSIFGGILRILPFLKGLLAHGIIIKATPSVSQEIQS